MTTQNERARSLVWAGAFLIELAKDRSLPITIRRTAVVIARHFPTTWDVTRMASHPFPTVELCDDDIQEWSRDYPHGPLLDSTRLAWPETKPAVASGKRKSARKSGPERLQDALAAANASRASHDSDCLEVWHELRAIDPELTDAILEIGLSESEAALWICLHGRDGESLADGALAGRRADVLAMVQRTKHGFVG